MGQRGVRYRPEIHLHAPEVLLPGQQHRTDQRSRVHKNRQQKEDPTNGTQAGHQTNKNHQKLLEDPKPQQANDSSQANQPNHTQQRQMGHRRARGDHVDDPDVGHVQGNDNEVKPAPQPQLRFCEQAKAPGPKPQYQLEQEERRKQVVGSFVSPTPLHAFGILPPQAAVGVNAHIQSVEHDDHSEAQVRTLRLYPVLGLHSLKGLRDSAADLRKSPGGPASGRALPVPLTPPLDPAARLLRPGPPGLAPVLPPLRVHHRV
mmetsp:Transcript_11089/g.28064  ORF Transcript_11089/g.28064 Transcript_11089/m.28064 type:complete len:260 (-) Transcript_11089:375-1154(-)